MVEWSLLLRRLLILSEGTNSVTKDCEYWSDSLQLSTLFRRHLCEYSICKLLNCEKEDMFLNFFVFILQIFK